MSLNSIFSSILNNSKNLIVKKHHKLRKLLQLQSPPMQSTKKLPKKSKYNFVITSILIKIPSAPINLFISSQWRYQFPTNTWNSIEMNSFRSPFAPFSVLYISNSRKPYDYFRKYVFLACHLIKVTLEVFLFDSN